MCRGTHSVLGKHLCTIKFKLWFLVRWQCLGRTKLFLLLLPPLPPADSMGRRVRSKWNQRRDDVSVEEEK